MLIDTHAHLFDGRFRADLPAVLDRAAAAGVGRVVCIGIDRDSNRDSVRLANAHPMLVAAVGLQPNGLAEVEPGDWDEVVRLAGAEPKVVAIGETGLDRYWDKAPFPLQEEYFARHMGLARRLGKPFVIHCREAEADTVRMLRAEFDRHGPIRAVMHSFSGDLPTARACLEMGLYISFAGMLTYPNAQSLRDVAGEVPLDRLLVETDCPYLAPVPHRGKRNEPAYVAHTAAVLAEAKGVSAAEIGEVTTRNARALFGLGDDYWPPGGQWSLRSLGPSNLA
jgi:TatD DNase family protein